ncbi:MAG: M48 family metallopeptidase [Rhizomicrobium sp.]
MRLLFPLLALLLLALSGPAMAQEQGQMLGLPPRAAPTVRIQVQPLSVVQAPQFDPARATAAYLARASAGTRAETDAYFDGGYWLILVNLLWTLAASALLLWLPISRSLRDWAMGESDNPTTQAMIYGGFYVPIMAAAEFPLAVYEGYFRAHAYGLSNQDFLGWLSDYGVGLGLAVIAALIGVPLLYTAIRHAKRTWWLWGAGMGIALQIVVVAIYPVFFAPLFNHYTALPDGPLKTQILSLAHANDVPANDVLVVAASRRTDRVSANVSGLFGTTRISLADNLLNQATPDEVLAVMGRAMGHYVMGHALRMILLDGLVILAAFAFLQWSSGALIAWAGPKWGIIKEIQDLAGLPLLVALASIFFFIATPVTNTIARSAEHQADIFGLDAVRKPDAFATVMLKLPTYGKLSPDKWEEIVFYDQPSGRRRIRDAMIWKKEHIHDPDIRDTAGPR